MASKAAASAAQGVKQAAKSADPWKYHIGDTSPFWAKFRKAMVVNPDSTTGNPINSINRKPEPASRPEKYDLPPSKASDIAQNPYFNRDFRRKYPRLDVITQNDLSALLLAQPELLNLPAPNNAPAQQAAEGTTDVTTVPSPAPSLSSLYLAPSSESTTAATSQPFYTPSKLPPLPAAGVKLAWSKAKEEVPRPEFAYFPMDTYSSTVVSQLIVEDHPKTE